DTGSGLDGNFWWCVDATDTCDPFAGAQELASTTLSRDFLANAEIGLRYFRFGVLDNAANQSAVASVPNRYQDAPTLDFLQTSAQFQAKGTNAEDNISGAGFYTFGVIYTDVLTLPTTIELWIDLDGNGTYDASERKPMLNTGGVPATGASYEISVNVPFIRATAGVVRYRFYANNGGQDAIDGTLGGDPVADNFLQINPYALDFPEAIQVRNNYQKPTETKPVVILIKDPRSPGAITVNVYLPDGRLVKSLADSPSYSADVATIFWDITDNSGGKVGAGVYMVVVKTSAWIETRKVIVIR
ncbi:MAG: hypothetical protein KDK38_08075, partial [Leptospiraceae bacterium]|nr:hypothetical protein [Leptospiraceae bacterium]